MADSPSHFKDLLAAFARYGVRYLVVGGHAVMLYAEPRWTKDLDLWIDTAGDNPERVFAALVAFGAPLGGCSPDDFRREGMVFQIGAPPLRVDILMSLSSVTFADAWRNRNEGTLYDKNRSWRKAPDRGGVAGIFNVIHSVDPV